MNSLGLYLHFPFCRRKCFYCDFYSGSNPEKIALYEEKLALFLENLPEDWQGRALESVYLGGGTPSLATTEGIRRIFSAVKSSFSLLPQCEISCEVNPDSASEEKLGALFQSGVNRLSIGMQSGNDEELKTLGRLHCFSQVENCVRAAKKVGFSNISLDLMYALPGQSMASWRESLEKALSLEVKHLSFYCLTLSEKVPLYRKKELLPDEEVQREMYFLSLDLLAQNGFEQYEISNAAKPGFESRHNLRYWERGEYLGVGPGAYSFLGGERFCMRANTDDFIFHSNFSDIIEDREKVTAEADVEELIMLSLRTKKGLSLAELEEKAGSEKRAAVEKTLSSLVPHGLCERTKDGFSLTKEGFFVSNEIISRLI